MTFFCYLSFFLEKKNFKFIQTWFIVILHLPLWNVSITGYTYVYKHPHRTNIYIIIYSLPIFFLFLFFFHSSILAQCRVSESFFGCCCCCCSAGAKGVGHGYPIQANHSFILATKYPEKNHWDQNKKKNSFHLYRPEYYFRDDLFIVSLESPPLHSLDSPGDAKKIFKC